MEVMNTNSCGQGFYIKQDNRACPLGCVECNEENNDFNNENQDNVHLIPLFGQEAQRRTKYC